LQWLDTPTLDLLEYLLTDRSATPEDDRRNEVDSTHALMRKLEAIRQAGTVAHDIVVAALTGEDLGQLIAILFIANWSAASLPQLIHHKTAGNPFFAIQFMSALAEEAEIPRITWWTSWSGS
jgi:predicted ATPase